MSPLTQGLNYRSACDTCIYLFTPRCYHARSIQNEKAAYIAGLLSGVDFDFNSSLKRFMSDYQTDEREKRLNETVQLQLNKISI